MTAFKSQQHRWAKGSIQTALKVLPALLAGPLPWRIKLEAVVHLTANVGYVLTLLLAVLVVPAVWLRAGSSPWTILAFDLPLFALASGSLVHFYLRARRASFCLVPFLMAVGIGLSLNNARAVAEALLGRRSGFTRTPKYNLGRGEGPASRRYRIPAGLDPWLEAALALYFTGVLAAAALQGIWSALPFLALFQAGFAYTAGLTLVQGWRRQR
jgi:hypothetical protein